MPDENPIISLKSEIRARMRALRAAVLSAERMEKSHLLCRRLVACLDEGVKLVCAYDALKSELDLGEFVSACAHRGIEVVFPEPRTPLATGSYSVPRAGEVDLWICPGLAFTRSGARLGFGGGWYDRFLAQAKPTARIIGVAYSFQIVDFLPQMEHDRPMDAIVTV